MPTSRPASQAGPFRVETPLSSVLEHNHSKEIPKPQVSGSTSYTNKCRVCLDRGKLPIVGEASHSVREALSVIAGIHIGEDKHLPRFVCFKCHSLLQGAMKLRNQAQETDRVLKEITVVVEDDGDYVGDETCEPERSITTQIDVSKSLKAVRREFYDLKLLDSQENEENEITYVKCELCGKKLSSKYSYLYHRTIHFDEFLFQDGNNVKDVTCKPEQSIATNSDVLKSSTAKPRWEKAANNLKLIDSQANEENKITYVKCKICGKKLKNMNSYIIHRKIHVDVLQVQDSENVKVKTPTNDVSKSAKAKQSRGKTVGDLKLCESQTNEENEIIMCEICGKQFSSKYTYYSHRTIHFDVFLFHCDLCPYRGKTKGLLISHMRKHKKGYQYQCSECPYRTNHKSNYRLHLANHKGRKAYKCDTCNKAFSSQAHLRDHQYLHHLGLRAHICDICGEEFGYPKGLRKHQIQVHNRKTINGGNAAYLKAERKRQQQKSALN